MEIQRKISAYSRIVISFLVVAFLNSFGAIQYAKCDELSFFVLSNIHPPYRSNFIKDRADVTCGTATSMRRQIFCDNLCTTPDFDIDQTCTSKCLRDDNFLAHLEETSGRIYDAASESGQAEDEKHKIMLQTRLLILKLKTEEKKRSVLRADLSASSR